MRRFLLLFAILLPIALTGCPPRGQNQFTSADLDGRYRTFFGDFLAPEAAPSDDAAGGNGASAPVREVVEPDVYRRVGNLLYVLNQFRGLMIIDLDSQEILGQAPTYGFPRDLYLENGRAYVLVGQANNYTRAGDTIHFELTSRLFVVDIGDVSKPAVLNTFQLDGDLVDSRMVGQVLYAVSAKAQWWWYDDAVFKDVSSDSWVTSVNIADTGNIFEADRINFPGQGTVIQATPSAIFVAAPDYARNQTTIQYVDIDDPAGAMAVRGAAKVKGHVADRFKLDAYEGVLRVVSSAWNDGQRIYLTTIDLADPDVLTELAELDFERARGDTLFATRFDGDRAYVVTYFLKDPLFIVDLRDPANPVISGELEVPGWSTHIEPRGDRLIALGVDDTNGRRVSVSLFDVADPTAPDLVERVSFGDNWSWSSAYEDVKAFSVFDDLLIVPFSGWSGHVGGYDRLQFVSWTESDLDVGGHVDLQGGLLRSFAYNDGYFGMTSEQLVALDATDRNEPRVTNRLTLAENVTDFVPLNADVGIEIVTRYDSGMTSLRATGLPLKNISEVEVRIGSLITALADGNSVVLVGSDWPEGGRYQDSWHYGGDQYIVARVDYSDPAQPQVIGPVSLPVAPVYFYGDFYPPIYEIDAVPRSVNNGATSPGLAKTTIAPGYLIPTGDNAFILGNKLALRGRADSYNVNLGGGSASQGLAVIALETMQLEQTVGLGFSRIVSVDAAQDKLYLGTLQDSSSGSPFAQPLVSYFLTQITLDGPSTGPTVNVPGRFVQYDPDSDLLVLEDHQWRLNWTTTSELKTVRWDGASPAVALRQLPLPEGVGQILGRGERVYFDRYDNGYWLHAVTVNADGGMALGSGVLVTNQWGTLIDAKGVSAYVGVGGNAVAQYTFNGTGHLATLTETMGIPASIRFGVAQAYGPTGYFGIVLLPL